MQSFMTLTLQTHHNLLFQGVPIKDPAIPIRFNGFALPCRQDFGMAEDGLWLDGSGDGAFTEKSS